MAASLDELKAALIQADEAGDSAAAQTFADEIRRMTLTPANLNAPKKLKIGAEGLPDAVAAVAGDFNPLTQLAVGAKAGWDNAAMRLKQIVTGGLSQEDQNTVAANRALVQESNPAMLGKFGFDLGATAAPAGALYRGVLATGFLPQAVAKSLAATAIGAGTAAATEPVLNGESTLGNATAGGVGGFLGDALMRGAGRMVRPLTSSPKVQELLNRDIVPTIGQAADEKTLLGRMVKSGEEKLQSIPFLGDVIRNARMRPHEEVNLAAIRTVYPEAKEIGHKGIQAAEDYANGLYQKALGKIDGVAIDSPFMVRTQETLNDKSLLLSRSQRKQMSDFFDDIIVKKFTGNDGNIMSAEMAKKIDSELGKKIRDLKGSTSAAEKDMGKAFEAIQRDFRDLINRNAPPEAAEALAEANRRWANFVRVRDAAASPGAKDGVFTPAQLQQAVRRGDYSAGKGRFAQGEALMQDISGPAKSVLGDTVPNSGTADRAFMTYVAAHPVQASVGLPLSLAMAIPYSRLGQQYMLGQFAGQGVLSDALRQGAPYAATTGGVLGGRSQWIGSQESR